jgi:predicted phage terminase large subunit-like protein
MSMMQVNSPAQSFMLSPEEAAKELLRRELAHDSLIDFTRYTFRDYRPAEHHRLIAEKLEAVERGEIQRLMIFMPPRHGKSELASIRFPAWFLGRNPSRSIIAASYNSDLAGDFGYKVREVVRKQHFANVFENVALAKDSQAANRWRLTTGGGYVSAGVGTSVTGRGADILLIDDPFKDREEADSETIREKVWRWYTSTAYTRLEGDLTLEQLEDDDIWMDFQEEVETGQAEPFEGAVVVIQCMTGDTPVLMATGKEKPLRDIRPGDEIATYENGKIATSTVRNWANQGPDSVYTIRMKSGTIVRANARHPFLVYEHGEETWQQTASLKKGSVILRATGESGRTLPARQTDVTRQPNAKACACRTTTNTAGNRVFARLRSILSLAGRRISGIATELTCQIMSAFSLNKAAFALSASSRPLSITLGRTGTASFASITATIAKRFADFFATTVIWQSDTEKQKPCCLPPLNTFAVIHDEVEEVIESGFEDVYDIQVDRTENFIANGLVSHNTRWHEDDLSGRLIEAEAKGGDQWEKLILPAVMSDGSALWPQKYPVSRLRKIEKAIGPRDWSALYQQEPSPDEGTFFQREWFKRHGELITENHHVYICSDYAVTDGDGDYTEHGVFGVGSSGRIYQLDWWHGQTSSDAWIEEKLRLIRKWKPIVAFGEAGVIQKAVEPMIRRRMIETGTRCRMEWLPSIHDKATRARGFQSRAAMGEVSLLDDERGERVLNQLLKFPAGKHDDAVDVCGMIGRALDMAHPAMVPPKPKKPESMGDYVTASRDGGDSWRL